MDTYSPLYYPIGLLSQLIYFLPMPPKAAARPQQNEGFGSTGQPTIFWSQKVSLHRPSFTCVLRYSNQDFQVSGILDSSADIAVIPKAIWPEHWPLVNSHSSLSGIGGRTLPKQSASLITAIGPDHRVASIRPYIVDSPIVLWGRDCLTQWGLSLTTDFS